MICFGLLVCIVGFCFVIWGGWWLFRLGLPWWFGCFSRCWVLLFVWCSFALHGLVIVDLFGFLCFV